MNTTRVFALCGTAVLLLAGSGYAQNNDKLALSVGAGLSQPVVHSDSRFDPGFNFNVGAGYKFTPHVNLMGEFGFQHLGVSSRILSGFGVPDGSGRIYSFTLNPMVRLNPRGSFDAYLTGGGGFYRRTVEFTEPGIATVTAFDPFFGFYPANIATNVVVGSYSQNKGGLNIGGGISKRLRAETNLRFFAEARYHYIYTSPIRTTVLPVTFGLRW